MSIDKLPELARFSDTKGVTPGEPLDSLLAATKTPIVLFASPESVSTAHSYRGIIGKTDRKRPIDFVVSEVNHPIEAAIDLDQDDSDVIPLVMYSATNRILNERMFADGPRLGQLLMGHMYIQPNREHQSPNLHAIGVSNKGLRILSELTPQSNELLTQKMAAMRKNLLKGDIYLGSEPKIPNSVFRDILRSNPVNKVIAHALGPEGTNIAQAMRQYVKTIGIEDKTEIIVHPGGVEPMPNERSKGYTEMATEQIEQGVIPIHMECAVYYRMGDTLNTRPGEVVFADHHYMMLDEMQLASRLDLDQLGGLGRVIKVATHPSPKPLINPWVNAGRAEWIKATSNSEASQMVLREEVDACITTGSGLAEAEGLKSLFVNGSPWMLFTIGTPLSQAQLRSYL